MIATVDAQWFSRNATKVFDAAAAKAGVEFHRGMDSFKGMLDEIGVPDLKKRELFRCVFDGRYKLVRYFGLGAYNLPASVEQLLADNDVALYDLSWILRRWTIWPTGQSQVQRRTAIGDEPEAQCADR